MELSAFPVSTLPNQSILPRGAMKTDKQLPVDINRVNRSYYLNLFSANAEKTLKGTKNSIFKWNIRDLQLGSKAEIALVQMVHTNAVNTTGYAIRCLETFADGYDSYNQTSAVLYLGMGLNTPGVPTYHKLISNNLNSITLVCTDTLTSSTTVNDGFGATITFGVILHILDYIDKENTY
jgi:hypothetical protein